MEKEKKTKIAFFTILVTQKHLQHHDGNAVSIKSSSLSDINFLTQIQGFLSSVPDLVPNEPRKAKIGEYFNIQCVRNHCVNDQFHNVVQIVFF